MTAQDHNRLLSIFFYIQAGIQLFVGLLLGLIYGGIGSVMLATGRKDEDLMMGGIFLVLAIVVGVIVIAFGIFDLIVATKIKNVRPIGRTLGIVASCLALFSFPLGTALGVYGIWFMLGDMGRALYQGWQQPGFRPQPPPNSWQ